jgi:hypothetical protein
MLKSKLSYVIAAIVVLTSCGKGGQKKGSELKGNEAIEYLAGDEKKTWELQSGHDYYEYLQFDRKGGAIYQSGIAIKCEAKDADLTLHEEGAVQDFISTYKIVEISDDKCVMVLPGHDTLTYVVSKEKLLPGKTVGKAVDAKWLKGKYGTSWKFVDGEKTYSFMNDGTILDANTLVKVDTWSIDGSTLNFGPAKLSIFRLSPVFFDYDVYGMTVKLNYVCEASKDGSPVRK